MSPSFERWVKSKLGGWTSWFFSSKGGRSFRSFSRCGGKDQHRRVGTMRPLGFSRMRGRKTAARTTPLLHLQHGHSTRRCREADHNTRGRPYLYSRDSTPRAGGAITLTGSPWPGTPFPEDGEYRETGEPRPGLAQESGWPVRILPAPGRGRPACADGSGCREPARPP